MFIAFLHVAMAAAPLTIPGEGWQITPPAGMTAAVGPDGTVQMLRPSGAGIAARRVVGYTMEQMLSEMAMGVPAGNFVIPPTGPAVPWGNGGYSEEFAGYGVAGRALIVPGVSESILVIGFAPLGEEMATTVEVVAKSVKWTALPAQPQAAALRGAYCAYEGSASGSVNWRIQFDGAGRMTERTTAVMTGDFYGQSGGNDVPGSYRLDGQTVTLRFDMGGASTCVIAAREGGSVSALRCDGKLFTQSMCE